MSELRPPLTPADCDLRDFQRMMIDISRLRQSSFDAILDDSAWRAGVNLWFSAWHAVPAGSLDNEDGSLAKAAGLGRDLKTWRNVKRDALRGFVECDDGRLYHETVCEFALEAWIEKLIQRLASGAGNAKRWKTEFDPALIEASLQDAAARLSLLAPASKHITKARRRDSKADATAIPPGQTIDPTGIDKPSHRDEKTVPVRSLETGTGTIVRKEPPTPKASRFAAERPEVRKVLDEGDFTVVPADKHLVFEWIALPNMELDRDILPIIKRASGEEMARRGRKPFTLKFFDSRIREQHAADEAELGRLRKARERIERQDQLQREEQ